jgi:hypothetical protein
LEAIHFRDECVGPGIREASPPTVEGRPKQANNETIVADAGMVSAANQRAIEAPGSSFILGTH